MNLVIISESGSSDDVTACDSFDWNGATYTESGTYTYTITNESGCYSTATLNLTINNSFSSKKMSCDSFDLVQRTESGTYTFATTNGVDSTATLNLTINNSSSSEDIETCGGYMWNGQLIVDSFDWNTTTYTLEFCDSTATLNFTQNNGCDSTVSFTTITACDSFEWNATCCIYYS